MSSLATFLFNRYFWSDKMVLLPFLFLCLFFRTNAQQLDQLGKKQGVKISGGLGLNQSLYFADGVPDRFNPYNYILSGNVAMNLYGINIPVSFTYSNRNFKYSQPFNIVGVSPSYKSLRLHGGYRTMTFSQYTLAGHNFLGGGLEWGHKGFKVAAMGGRLLRGVEFDSDDVQIKPAYERLGTGIMLGYGKDGDEITFITFYAKDQANSIRTVPTIVGLRPMENQIYSLGFKKKLSDNVSVYFEGARSGLTRDVRDSSESNVSGFYRTVYFLSQNQNTEFKNAFKTGFNFNLTAFQLGLNFERVDPGYNTLGAYYVNSDFQNLTGSFSTQVFKDKVNISANAGLQRDDLNNQKMSKMKRFVGSLNLSMRFSKRFTASAAYSNFNSFTNIKPVDQAFVQNTIYDRIDTLNFIQINQTVNASLNYVPLDNSRVIHQLSLGGNYNTAVSKTSGNRTQNAMSGGRLSYMLNWKESGLNVGLNANNNTNYYVQGQASFWGLGFVLSKPVLNKKLRISLNGNASNNYENGRLTAMLYSVTNSYSVKLGKHHSLNASMRYSGRQSKSTAELSYYKTTFNEFMGNLGYFFTF